MSSEIRSEPQEPEEQASRVVGLADLASVNDDDSWSHAAVAPSLSFTEGGKVDLRFRHTITQRPIL